LTRDMRFTVGKERRLAGDYTARRGWSPRWGFSVKLRLQSFG
jgi:hypothetical protein